MKKVPITFERTIVLVAVLVFCVSILVAKGPEEDKPSSYAPLADLAAQMELFVDEIADDLEDTDDYGEDQQNRILLNSSTLIVLGQIMGMHDETHPYKKAAPRLIEAADDLSDNIEDLAAAEKSLSDLRESLKSTAGGEVDWEPVADLGALMRQVPIVNNSLRRGVTGRRFERMIDKCAGAATTLAAIAQASVFYTDYCADDEDEAKWAQICIEMRNAAAQVNTAVRRKDKATALAGLEKLVESCDDCHHVFRD